MKILAVYEDADALNLALSKIGKVFEKHGLIIVNLQSIQIYNITVMGKEDAKKVVTKFAEFNGNEDILIICNKSLYKRLYSKNLISEAHFLGSGGWAVSTYFKIVCPVFEYHQKGRLISSM